MALVTTPSFAGATEITLDGSNYLGTVGQGTPLTGTGYDIQAGGTGAPTRDLVLRSAPGVILHYPVRIGGWRHVHIIGLDIRVDSTTPGAGMGLSGFVPGACLLRIDVSGCSWIEGCHLDLNRRSADGIVTRNLIGGIYNQLKNGYTDANARGSRDILIQHCYVRGNSGDSTSHGDFMQTSQGGGEVYRYIEVVDSSMDTNCEGFDMESVQDSGGTWHSEASVISFDRFDYRWDPRFTPNPNGSSWWKGGAIMHQAASYQYSNVYLYDANYGTAYAHEYTISMSGNTTVPGNGSRGVWGPTSYPPSRYATLADTGINYGAAPPPVTVYPVKPMLPDRQIRPRWNPPRTATVLAPNSRTDVAPRSLTKAMSRGEHRVAVRWASGGSVTMAPVVFDLEYSATFPVLQSFNLTPGEHFISLRLANGTTVTLDPVMFGLVSQLPVQPSVLLPDSVLRYSWMPPLGWQITPLGPGRSVVVVPGSPVPPMLPDRQMRPAWNPERSANVRWYVPPVILPPDVYGMLRAPSNVTVNVPFRVEFEVVNPTQRTLYVSSVKADFTDIETSGWMGSAIMPPTVAANLYDAQFYTGSGVTPVYAGQRATFSFDAVLYSPGPARIVAVAAQSSLPKRLVHVEPQGISEDAVLARLLPMNLGGPTSGVAYRVVDGEGILATAVTVNARGIM